MALKLDEKYAGYMNPASIDYPQGSFKNRTSPTSEDGSYFEEAWANDIQGFIQSLIAEAALTPSGQPDKVGASQYLEALKKVIKDAAPTPAQATELIAGISKVATSAVLSAGVNNDSFATAKGIKDAGLWPLGVGQTWRNMAASRAFNTTYTNQTTRPMLLSIATTQIVTDGGITLLVDGVVMQTHVRGQALATATSVTGLVQPGGTYRVNTANPFGIQTWMELSV